MLCDTSHADCYVTNTPEGFVVYCADCCLESVPKSTESEAIKAWKSAETREMHRDRSDFVNSKSIDKIQ